MFTMIASERYLTFLGHSIFQKDLEAFLNNELGMTTRSEGDSDGTMVISDSKEVFLEFQPATLYNSFIYNYGEPRSKLTKDPKELILTEITFHSSDHFPLPYGLEIGDHENILIKKLGKRPSECSRSDEFGREEYAYRFRVDDFHLLAKTDRDRCLLWLRFWQLSLTEKAKIELKKMRLSQNRRMKPENAPLVLAQKTKIPALGMADGAFGAEMSSAFEAYVDRLAKTCDQKSAAKAHSAVKKLVKTLNRFSEQIDTEEREQFVAFIHESLALTGFEIPTNVDLTEQWRDW